MKIIKFIFLTIAISLFGCQVNPDGLKFEENYLKGIDISSKENKPIFLYFAGYGCMGYNEFYNDLITSEEIQKKLNEEFVTIQLYVDDRKDIQKIDTIGLHKLGFTKNGKEKLNTALNIGNVNAIIEMDLFKSNSQPLYLILDSERNILVEPFGYTKKERKYFLAKLNEGLKEFKKEK